MPDSWIKCTLFNGSKVLLHVNLMSAIEQDVKDKGCTIIVGSATYYVQETYAEIIKDIEEILKNQVIYARSIALHPETG